MTSANIIICIALNVLSYPFWQRANPVKRLAKVAITVQIFIDTETHS